MKPERWRRLSEVYHAALALDADQREAYLKDVIADDPSLRQEVVSLLANERSAQEFLGAPALEGVAAAVTVNPQTSLVGRQLGPYTIVSWLGAGGMGEVYRARDATLGRDVAIKLLPRASLSDQERLARFEREARLLAALNHPHVGVIYGFEQAGDLRGIVLELIEGPTLADLLAASPAGLPLDRGLAIASEIAEALDAAHEKGIVHRDLKPANIKITPKGEVKVLDFGLATIESSDGSASDLSQSPTITVGATHAGVILGTASYMSPEQARGKPIDKRTDLWSFGCVLYEILTGTLAFPGETVSDTIAAILEREPDWNKLPAATPATVRRLLQRCLAKDATQRMRDIGDARVELDQVREEERHASGPRATGAAAARRSRWAMAAAGFALVAVLAGVVFVNLREPSASTVAEPIVQLTDFTDSAVLYPSLSPDGRMVTFLRGGFFGTSAGLGQIYVKILPTGEPVQLTRDETTKEHPVFSPDGSRIVYTSVQPGFKWDSWQVSVLGGSPKPFLPNASGLVWLNDQRLMYAEIMTGVHMGIVQSTESRSDHKTVYFPPLSGGMTHRAAPSPDGRSVLVVEMDGGGWLPCRLMPLDGSSSGRSVVGPRTGSVRLPRGRRMGAGCISRPTRSADSMSGGNAIRMACPNK
jgi:hypothetical protein